MLKSESKRIVLLLSSAAVVSLGLALVLNSVTAPPKNTFTNAGTSIAIKHNNDKDEITESPPYEPFQFRRYKTQLFKPRP